MDFGADVFPTNDEGVVASAVVETCYVLYRAEPNVFQIIQEVLDEAAINFGFIEGNEMTTVTNLAPCCERKAGDTKYPFHRHNKSKLDSFY